MTPANLPHLLHELKQHLLFLSGQVEDAVAKVVQAIMTRDSRLAREVIAECRHRQRPGRIHDA